MPNYPIDVDSEVEELRGIFPDVGRDDFYELNNGNIGAILVYDTSGQYSKGTFKVLLEYPPGFPDTKPNAWVMEPEVDRARGHVYRDDENGHAQICFTGDRNWSPNYTGYDAAAMIKSWIFGYCKWESMGEWD